MKQESKQSNMIGGYQDCEYLFFLQCIIYTITSLGQTLGCYNFFSTFLVNHEMCVYFQLVEILDDHFIKGKNSATSATYCVSWPPVRAEIFRAESIWKERCLPSEV